MFRDNVQAVFKDNKNDSMIWIVGLNYCEHHLE